jgi:hypothetical protein
MYRAYSQRHLLHEYAATIARDEFMHPKADARVSLPVPNDISSHSKRCEMPREYANRAMDEMIYFQSSLLPTQILFISIPHQTFNKYKNHDYFDAFIDLLSERKNDLSTNLVSAPMFTNKQLSFDFAGQPLPLSQTVQPVSKLRNTFPEAMICYHHGEVCPGISFGDRVRDTFELLPYVNRIGHGLCFGLALLNLYSEENGVLKDKTTIDRATLEVNRNLALQCLSIMAQRNIGIEISPTCNITLGSAFSPDVLRRYVAAFLQEGVHIFLGTDDPAFLNTT